MAYEESPFGPVAIIPARAMRDNRDLLRSAERTDSRVPINAAYYLTPQRRAPSYDPYPSSTAPGPPPAPGSAPPPRRYHGSYYQGGVSVPYTPPTPSSYRRSATAPESGVGAVHSRTTPRVYKTRSYSHTSVFEEPTRRDAGSIKYFSGPHKLPEPLYKKRHYFRSRPVPVESYELSGGRRTPSVLGVGAAPYTESATRHSFRSIAPGSRDPGATRSRRQTVTREETPRGLRRNYAPTYTTYPPSSVFQRGTRSERARGRGVRYSNTLRVTLKIAQLIISAVVIGTVCGATEGVDLGSFARLTNTEGQIAVVIFAAVCMFFTAGFLVSVGLAKSAFLWRACDAAFSVLAVVLFLIAGGVESWYANCYPPYGVNYQDIIACRPILWIIAAIFCFVNFALYGTDFALSMYALRRS